jgi:DNA-binding transcriptional ArsR family regulator
MLPRAPLLTLRRQLTYCFTIRAGRPTLKYVPNYSGTLDQVFQALADATRRSLVERLIRSPASVSELAQPLAMSLPAVMQHLAVLEACGLVRSEKVGRVRTCRIDPEALRRAETWITAQRTAWEQRLDQLGEVLAEQPAAPAAPPPPAASRPPGPPQPRSRP